MVNKIDAAKEISEILNLKWKDNFSSSGSTITTIWFENIANKLNNLVILSESIDFKEYIEGQNKIPKAKKIANIAGFKIEEEWFKASKPNSTSKGGSTVKLPYFEEFLIWIKDNYHDKEKIQDLEHEIVEALENIYENSNRILDEDDLHFEKSDFLNYGINYNWLKSLRPVWKCLYPNVEEIDWNEVGDDILNQVFDELCLDQCITYYENASTINDHLNIVIFLLEEYNSNLDVHKFPKSKCKTLWEESWGEIDASKGVFEPISARLDNVQISTIASWAKSGKLDIDPIYQRDFVWNDPSCRMLINSILMGVPLPSIILYEDQKGVYQIIDGKQRITSILRFIGALPEAKKFVMSKITSLKVMTDNEMVKNCDNETLADIILTGKNNLNFKEKDVPKYKNWKKNKYFGLISKYEIDEMGKKKLPFALGTKEFNGLPDFEKLNGKYYHEIRDEYIKFGDSEAFKISDIFELQSKYSIPTITYEKSTKPYQIRRVFHRYNTQGQKLNATEVNNAAYQSIDAMRLTMAMGRIRPEKGEIILPGIYDKVEPYAKVVEEFFVSVGENNKRFQYAKIISWTLALLYKRPAKKKNGTLTYPSTAGMIQQFFEEEMDEEVHDRAIQKEKNVVKIAEIFGNSAESLQNEFIQEVLNQNPNWSSKKGDGKWAQLAIVSMITASIICHTSDVKPEEKIEDGEIHQELIDYLENHQQIDKQQSRRQWEYFAETITDVCNIFGVNKENYIDKYDLFGGYSALKYFSEIIDNKEV